MYSGVDPSSITIFPASSADFEAVQSKMFGKTVTPFPTAPTAPGLVVDACGVFGDPSLQSVLLRANENDTITVMPGRYNERITLRKNVHISGFGNRTDVVIECAAESGLAVIDSLAESASLSNLSIICTNTGPSVEVRSGYLVLQNVEISCPDGVAVIVTGSKSSAAIVSCDVHDCGSSAIVISDTAMGTVLVDSCRIYKNNASSKYQNGSIVVRGTVSNATIVNCLLKENGSAGVYIANAGVRIENNVIEENSGAGIYVDRGSELSASPSPVYIVSNVINKNDEDGVHLEGSSLSIVERNTLLRNRGENIFVNSCPKAVISMNAFP
mmetsp:Transcript_42986/g.69745  ORF Transcript_42986/g.69745 Transcript_42986/m.69745 type:complete len:327 (+) Transcript_42986:88-1068(+)|eukprot:CAMPEP_0184675676 /NCGR_PEP_ID=MMETSP0308-20130426/87920_1 /TAXON_ID=38269 /ORGANISM="Gloeochaete witrockiana, Strain SAG 46.84" /LENGTH=326 /DNA_ID=CAMNT_0027123405 /DNA_START=1933 /DNA_END=2913 /DNA_ORIENTATION=-